MDSFDKIVFIIMTSNVDARPILQLLVIVSCVIKTFSRNVTKMVLSLSFCFKSYHEKYFMKIIPVFW